MEEEEEAKRKKREKMMVKAFLGIGRMDFFARKS